MIPVSTPTTKIIIADDHGLFAEGVEEILNHAPGFEIIAKVDNGKMLMQTLNRLSPDLILLDIHMPYMDGLETAAALKKRFPAIKIVFVSMTYDPSYKVFMQKHEIDGFMNKNVTAALLKETLHNIMAGQKVFLQPNQITPSEEVTLSPESDFLKLYKLTRTEKEIIQLIAKGNSTKMIAAERKLSYQTIESHRKNIFRKLGAKNMAEVVAFAARHELI